MNPSDNPSHILFAEERKNEIIKLVNFKGKVFVPDLVAHFNVSPATIRNDLRELEGFHLIKRTHGGAIPIESEKVGFEMVNQQKSVEHIEQKKMIAKSALNYIEEGDIIILDTGTTTLELAKMLKNMHITVIVNDIDIAHVLEEYEHVQVVLIGGNVRKKFRSTVGPFALKMLSEINVDKVFLAVNGFSMTRGGTTPDVNQAEIKKKMIEISTNTILLADSSKIGKSSFVQFAAPSQITTLITDPGIDSSHLEQLQSLGIEVVISEA
ncbi:DeoR/GlpR family DNA-binding transcription regulator [Paenibacillus radicis (ex Xue et al. 2023)]|uniref:DeoR/GlpR family DNA-binding transcription regulator n=1 Tax=Paenibacillus radicis (ex Xue et al. 2023) TaxID=2972489 RepID=A0ABT1YM41_9BACL|nr:DeoR/GlpR family DNA-binding transcription regulator [Paenibacillus radicis (ex Xue et al. 2023)]MCR8633045.1 DeoR/GlpR family DNA-binding transcription regulator [Paenibacillus radicis (ex Xue et al. 2023)]